MLKNRIKEFREKNDLTTYQLADKVGTTQPQIFRLENKNIRQLKIEWIERIAGALKMPIWELIDAAPALSAKAPQTTDKVIWDVMEVIIAQARRYPNLDVDKLLGIAMATYRVALAGKLPNVKGKASGRKMLLPLETETARLIEYEQGKLN